MWFGGLPGKIIWQSFMSAVTLLFSWHRNTLNVSSSFRDAGTSDINKRTNNSCFCHFSDWQNMEVGVGSGETESWFKMFVETKYILTLCPWLMASLFGPLKEQNRRNCLLFQSWKQIWFLGLFQAVNMFLFSGTFDYMQVSQHVDPSTT